ncbi:hypothetical protein [Nesterenkonia sp. K-15-9-6]|uniref:hypothetical protein n=1 Tax=Nesterenkonia sp. K-15-9-6 TaxID=3093918 RepID=UPI004043DC26
MTSTQGAHAARAAGTLTRRAVHGGLGGLAGGVVFGMMMAAMGMLPMVGALVGVESAAVGGLVHMGISLLFGVVFGVVITSARPAPLLLLGAGYGVVLWVVGALLIMPAMLGMPVFMINAMTLQSLVGHLVFGLVTAAAVWLLRRHSGSLDLGDMRAQHA